VGGNDWDLAEIQTFNIISSLRFYIFTIVNLSFRFQDYFHSGVEGAYIRVTHWAKNLHCTRVCNQLGNSNVELPM